MKKISINASKKYEVLIERGLLKKSGELIKKVLPDAQKLLVVTDDTVKHLYGESKGSFISGLRDAGFEVYSFVFKDGENSKTPETLLKILEFSASPHVGLSRTDAIVALGGGVVGDMAGFAAASYLRGIPFVQVSTTLLAAADSSVGGKTAVNLEAGKNLMGAFWQASLVLFDPDTLETLSADTYADGIAEIAKCGFIMDYSIIEKLGGQSKYEVEEIVSAAIEVKKRLVEEDERDTGRRQLLNFGHTVGHAREKPPRRTRQRIGVVFMKNPLATYRSFLDISRGGWRHRRGTFVRGRRDIPWAAP